MVDKKKLMKDFVIWGTENDKNRQEAIDTACRVISVLYATPSGKKVTEAELENIANGGSASPAETNTAADLAANLQIVKVNQAEVPYSRRNKEWLHGELNNRKIEFSEEAFNKDLIALLEFDDVNDATQ